MLSHKSALIAAFAAMLALVLPAGRPAMAEPEYRVFAGTSGEDVRPPFSNLAQTAESHYSFSEPDSPQNMRRGDAFARSGPGQVGATTHAITYYPNVPSLATHLVHGAVANASFNLDDLIIVFEEDPSQVGSVQGSFSVELSGSQSANAVAISGMGYSSAGSAVVFEIGLRFPVAIIIPGVFQPDVPTRNCCLLGSLSRGTTSFAPSAIGENSEVGYDLLAGGFDGHEVFTSSVGTLPVGMPFGIDVRLEVASGVRVERLGEPAASEFRYGESAAGFGNTLGFPLDVDVFNLPPGYTVHSVSGGIVDNRFFPIPIPEPSTIALLACGICTLLLHRRGKSGQERMALEFS